MSHRYDIAWSQSSAGQATTVGHDDYNYGTRQRSTTTSSTAALRSYYVPRGMLPSARSGGPSAAVSRPSLLGEMRRGVASQAPPPVGHRYHATSLPPVEPNNSATMVSHYQPLMRPSGGSPKARGDGVVPSVSVPDEAATYSHYRIGDAFPRASLLHGPAVEPSSSRTSSAGPGAEKPPWRLHDDKFDVGPTWAATTDDVPEGRPTLPSPVHHISAIHEDEIIRVATAVTTRKPTKQDSGHASRQSTVEPLDQPSRWARPIAASSRSSRQGQPDEERTTGHTANNHHQAKIEHVSRSDAGPRTPPPPPSLWPSSSPTGDDGEASTVSIVRYVEALLDSSMTHPVSVPRAHRASEHNGSSSSTTTPSGGGSSAAPPPRLSQHALQSPQRYGDAEHATTFVVPFMIGQSTTATTVGGWASAPQLGPPPLARAESPTTAARGSAVSPFKMTSSGVKQARRTPQRDKKPHQQPTEQHNKSTSSGTTPKADSPATRRRDSHRSSIESSSSELAQYNPLRPAHNSSPQRAVGEAAAAAEHDASAAVVQCRQPLPSGDAGGAQPVSVSNPNLSQSSSDEAERRGRRSPQTSSVSSDDEDDDEEDAFDDGPTSEDLDTGSSEKSFNRADSSSSSLPHRAGALGTPPRSPMPQSAALLLVHAYPPGAAAASSNVAHHFAHSSPLRKPHTVSATAVHPRRPLHAPRHPSEGGGVGVVLPSTGGKSPPLSSDSDVDEEGAAASGGGGTSSGRTAREGALAVASPSANHSVHGRLDGHSSAAVAHGSTASTRTPGRTAAAPTSPPSGGSRRRAAPLSVPGSHQRQRSVPQYDNSAHALAASAAIANDERMHRVAPRSPPVHSVQTVDGRRRDFDDGHKRRRGTNHSTDSSPQAYPPPSLPHTATMSTSLAHTAIHSSSREEDEREAHDGAVNSFVVASHFSRHLAKIETLLTALVGLQYNLQQPHSQQATMVVEGRADEGTSEADVPRRPAASSTSRQPHHDGDGAQRIDNSTAAALQSVVIRLDSEVERLRSAASAAQEDLRAAQIGLDRTRVAQREAESFVDALQRRKGELSAEVESLQRRRVAEAEAGMRAATDCAAAMALRDGLLTALCEAPYATSPN